MNQINVEEFFKVLGEQGLNFFTGVPDSLLKAPGAWIMDNVTSDHHVLTANEGNAIAVATGHYLATGNPAVVYMQNSGLGNTVNPLTSLASKEVYSVPMLLLVGWRGEPEEGKKDEPQHKQMGRIQNALLDAIEVPHIELGTTTREMTKALTAAKKHFDQNSSPFAILVRKGTFADYELKNKLKTNYALNREQALEVVVPLLEKTDIIISTTGKTSRELFELRESRGEGHEKDFLCVGNMGHTSSLALGVALSIPKRRIFCFDGDGSFIMHMGATGVIAQKKPKNLVHIVFNNFAHDSVGGQPTAADTVDFVEVAKACKYPHTTSVETPEEIAQAIEGIKNVEGPVFIEIKCNKGSRKDLGRPTTTPKENKEAFMSFIKN